MIRQQVLSCVGVAATLGLFVVPSAVTQQTSEAKRVSVAPFDQMAVQSSVEETFGGQYDLGKGIAELVRKRLVELGAISSDSSDAAGRVEGTIVFFGKESARGEATGVSVGGVRLGLGRKKEVALVMLEAHLVDIASGQTVTVVSGQGKSDKGGWDLAATTRGGAELGSVDLSGDAFTKSSLGLATHQAVDELAKAVAGATRQLGTITVAPPSEPMIAAPAPSGGPVMMGGGPMVGWMPYMFKGTEHFRYDIRQVDGGESKTGSYQLDLQPAGEGRVRLSVAGNLGDDAYSSTITTGVGTSGMQVGMGQLMALGPIGITLFNPAAWMMFAGHELEVGDGWSYSSGGESLSVKVESQCQHAGLTGYLVVLRSNDSAQQESCVAKDVALPLHVKLQSDDGSVIEMTLTEYRP